MRTFLAVVVIVASIQSAPQAVEAMPAKGSDAFETHLSQGMDLFKGHDYAGALAEFMKAYIIVQEPNLVYNIARCHEELKQYEEAMDFFDKYLELDPPDEGKVEALQKIESLKKKVGFGGLDLQVSEAGATVLVDGAAVGKSPLDGAIDLAPGEHVVEVFMEGFQTWSQTVQVSKGAIAITPVELVPHGASVTPPVVVAPASAKPWWPWLVVGLGGAAVATGSILYGMGASDIGAIEDASTDGSGAVTGITQNDADVDGKDAASLGNLGLGVLIGGAVVAAAGVTLALTLGGDEPSPTPVTLVPSLGGLVLSGSF